MFAVQYYVIFDQVGSELCKIEGFRIMLTGRLSRLKMGSGAGELTISKKENTELCRGDHGGTYIG